MEWLLGLTLLWGVYLRMVVSDKNCEEVMKKQNVTFKCDDNGRSSYLEVCSGEAHVKWGEDYPPALLENKPTISYDVGKDCSYVTIVFFGRNPGSDAMNLLWVFYNVEAEALKNGFTGETGNERVSYTKPKTGEGADDHFFLVFCQDAYLKNFNCCTNEERNNFRPSHFVQNNSLKEVIAGLYFRVAATGEVMKDADVKQDNVCSKIRT